MYQYFKLWFIIFRMKLKIFMSKQLFKSLVDILNTSPNEFHLIKADIDLKKVNFNITVMALEFLRDNADILEEDKYQWKEPKVLSGV